MVIAACLPPVIFMGRGFPVVIVACLPPVIFMRRGFPMVIVCLYLKPSERVS